MEILLQSEFKIFLRLKTSETKRFQEDLSFYTLNTNIAQDLKFIVVDAYFILIL